jgi:hypothetical protein
MVVRVVAEVKVLAPDAHPAHVREAQVPGAKVTMAAQVKADQILIHPEAVVVLVVLGAVQVQAHHLGEQAGLVFQVQLLAHQSLTQQVVEEATGAERSLQGQVARAIREMVDQAQSALPTAVAQLVVAVLW